MNWPAAIANSLWVASSLPENRRFRQALKQPDVTQERLLLRLVTENATTTYGRRYRFERIRTCADFAANVPVVDYSDLEPLIARIRSGEERVLTSEPVTHLIPTSGSSGTRKLIPFTRGLQHEFNRAVGTWIVDLARQHPGILLGPAYWSISPPPQLNRTGISKVPIGFSGDADYLGGNKSRLIRAALVFPHRLHPGCDLESFQFETLLALLRAPELRFISVWHPSFLTLLLDALPAHWEKLLTKIAALDSPRANGLLRCAPDAPKQIWPNLCVVSCWGDAMAESAMNGLRKRLPQVFIQPKGLLATEACVTIPFGPHHPVAISSHFFEFIDANGRFRRVHELQRDETYEVVVTTGGGLWRYRLGDRVQVKGLAESTPSLRFLERSGNVSDLFGEKISEEFAQKTIKALLNQDFSRCTFAMLAPSNQPDGWRYQLYFEGEPPLNAEDRLEMLLSENPHYAICRQLDQLKESRIKSVMSGAYERYVSRLTALGMRLGDIKPASLSKLDSWEGFFR